MRDFFKNKVATILIVTATIILAGVAIFTAVRLYQLRDQSVAPTAPESRPAAEEKPKECTSLTFNITTPSPTLPPGEPTNTPTPTTTPSPTGTITPSPTLPPGEPTNTPTDTPQATETPGPTSTDTPSTPSPTTQIIAQVTPVPTGAQLPAAGVELPTIALAMAGILLLILSFVLLL